MNNRVCEIRKALRLNQTDFGKRLGVTAAAISKMESGDRSVTEQMILAICREFGVNEEWLRSGKGDMFNEPSDLFELLGYKADTLDPDTEKVIKSFLLMTEEERKIFMKFIKKIAGDLT